MKTYAEILKDIENAVNNLKQNEELEKQLQNKWIAVDDLMDRREIFKEVEKDIVKAESTSRDIRIALHIMRNNARIALFHETMPILLEILKKYKGKPYGEKTREKIASELEERAVARAFIRTKYNQDEIDIYPAHHHSTQYSITVGPKYNDEIKGFDRILVDNKIQCIPFERFGIWYIKNEYIEDVAATVETMKKLHGEALALQEQLNVICSNFNKYAVEGIDSIYCDKRLYKTIQTR